MTARSPSSSGPGLFSTRSGTRILPTSCSRAANSSSISAAGSSCSISPDHARQLDDVLGVLGRAPVAQVHRRGERRDVRRNGVAVGVARARVIERRGRHVGQLANDLDLGGVEAGVLIGDRDGQHAADGPLEVDRRERRPHCAVGEQGGHWPAECGAVRDEQGLAGRQHAAEDALVRAHARADQLDRRCRVLQPRSAPGGHCGRRTKMHARDDVRHAADVLDEPLEDEALVAARLELLRCHGTAG